MMTCVNLRGNRPSGPFHVRNSGGGHLKTNIGNSRMPHESGDIHITI
jgi:hypothetical protein